MQHVFEFKVTPIGRKDVEAFERGYRRFLKKRGLADEAALIMRNFKFGQGRYRRNPVRRAQLSEIDDYIETLQADMV